MVVRRFVLWVTATTLLAVPASAVDVTPTRTLSVDESLAQALAVHAMLGGTGSPAEGFAGLAAAGVAFAGTLEDPLADPSGFARALAPLRASHAEAASRLMAQPLDSDLTFPTIDSPGLGALALQPVPPRDHALAPVPTHASLPAVVGEIARRAGHPLSTDEAAHLAVAQDALGASLPAYLTILNAYLSYDDAARTAFGEETDLGLLVAARNRLAAQVAEALPGLHPVNGPPDFQVCGVIAIDYNSRPTTYGCDVLVSIDAGGNDLYLNNAGGNMAGTSAALAVDARGNDQYLATRSSYAAVLGSGALGAGALIDGGGSDTYYANLYQSGLASGSAHDGVGLLLDLGTGGRDTYSATLYGWGAANGGGLFEGAGALIDADGADQYSAWTQNGGAVNGGAYGGLGLLVDQGTASESYYGTLGGSGGANGGALGGIGLLFDGGGGNTFVGQAWPYGGVNGGATGFLPGNLIGENPHAALGVLATGPGSDYYYGTGVGNGGGLLYGMGLLLDLGSGSYVNNFVGSHDRAGQGAGVWGGFGLVVDRGVESWYSQTALGSAQGAARQGVGLVLRQVDPPQDSVADSHNGTGPTTYWIAPASARVLEATGGGVAYRLDPVARSVYYSGTQPELECGSQGEIGDYTTSKNDVRLCQHDAALNEPVYDPVLGRQVSPVPKPPVNCNIITTCVVLDQVLGPGFRDWLDDSRVYVTTGGGLTILVDNPTGGLGTRVETRGFIIVIDRICGAICDPLEDLIEQVIRIVKDLLPGCDLSCQLPVGEILEIVRDLLPGCGTACGPGPVGPLPPIPIQLPNGP